MRGDLVSVLHDRVRDRAAILFGERICSIRQSDLDVEVAFAHAAPQRFDVVVGADGVHSATRALADIPFSERLLGCWAASFTVPGYTHHDPGAYVSFTEVGRQIARYELRDGRTAFLPVFRESDAPAGAAPSTRALATLLKTEYRAAWEWPEILGAMKRSEDCYFDVVSQIHAPLWSNGRVALVGDAAYCPSLLSGEGASLAMAGAYLLAGELARAHEPAIAFERYERQLRPLIERKQRNARRLSGWFAPRTSLGLLGRNLATRMAAVPSVGPAILRSTLEQGMELPAYRLRPITAEST